MKTLAQLGCLARAAVYFLMGILALLVAFGSSYGATTDQSGVLRRLVDQPYGPALLLGLAVGLFSYAIWRILQSVQDHDLYGRGPKGFGIRIAFFMSGLFHAFLGFYALNLIFGFTKHTTLRERVMAHWVLLQPYGRVMLATVGVAVVIGGTVQFVRAFNVSFLRDLRLPRRKARWMMAICRFGITARGIVFIIIGSFFLNAAWTSRSREVGGLHRAWETLHQQIFGDLLLGVVALGFVSFGVFALIEGFYRKRIV